MKRSPDMQRLDEMLRASKISAFGFMGGDNRPVEEIVAADAATALRMGRSPAEIAARMKAIAEAAKRAQGTPTAIDAKLEAVAMEVRGVIPCPWPHPGRYEKTVTTARRTDTGREIRWSGLNIHMIEAHGFFEGRGSPFRVEPRDLIEIIF